MAWTTPRTWVVGELVTAALLNTHLRDNLDALPRASDTAAVDTSQTTTSTSYTDLATAGPAVTLTTGTKAWVTLSAGIFQNSDIFESLMSFAVSGATTRAAADDDALSAIPSANGDGVQASFTMLVTGLTAGSNVFTAKYRVLGGTGTFRNRKISVFDARS